MSLRRIAMLVALCALAAVSFASSASASTFIRSGSTTGSTYSGPFSAAQEGVSFITNGSGNIHCQAGSLTATAGASGGATVPVTINSLTFTNCESTNPFVTVTSCHRSASSLASVAATAPTGTGTLTIPQNGITVQCYNGSSVVCTFTDGGGSITGIITDQNGGSTLQIRNASITTTSGICPSPSSLDAAYFPLRTEPGGALLYVTDA